MKTLTILIVFLMAACGGGSTDSKPSASEAYAMATETEVSDLTTMRKVSSPQQSDPTFEKKVVKTGGLSYQVESTQNEYQRISSLLEQFEAYISSENENKGYDRINYNVSIKVPPQHFNPLIGALTKDKKLDNRWVNTDDVTERYYDLQSRIENKKKLEERYQEILKKAENVRDILEVERNLNQVRTEIESLEGQFKLLSHRVNFSTIDISFYELVPYELNQEPRPGFGTRIINSITAGWQGFLTFMVYLLALWPFGILAFIVVTIVKKIRAKRKKDDL
ncbi:DUF4349 domain-containing protein [Ekhidna sp.]